MKRIAFYLWCLLGIGYVQAQSPMLLSPADGDSLQSSYPVFSWLSPPLNGGSSFTFRLVEQLPHQSPSVALLSNPVLHERTGLRSMTYLYPIDAPALLENRSYAWQVIRLEQGQDEGEPALSSPFSFHRKSPVENESPPHQVPRRREERPRSRPKKPKKDKKIKDAPKVYAHLHQQIPSVVHVFRGEYLAFQYQREYLVSEGNGLQPKVYDEFMRPVAGDWQTNPRFIHQGDNRFLLDVEDLDPDVPYLLEVRSSKGERWFLKFKKHAGN